MAKHLTPCKAIRLFCIDCCGGNRKGPRRCQDKECPLYAFRLGRNPNYSKKISSHSNKKLSPENSIGKQLNKDILQRISKDGIIIPDGYEVIIRKKGLTKEKL
ncbi:MAG TPA: hypothetical protein ENI52_01285 [Thermoplasmata archaeon]|nr:hypothetical protein [Thermoplasmata archaeon]